MVTPTRNLKKPDLLRSRTVYDPVRGWSRETVRAVEEIEMGIETLVVEQLEWSRINDSSQYAFVGDRFEHGADWQWHRMVIYEGDVYELVAGVTDEPDYLVLGEFRTVDRAKAAAERAVDMFCAANPEEGVTFVDDFGSLTAARFVAVHVSRRKAEALVG